MIIGDIDRVTVPSGIIITKQGHFNIQELYQIVKSWYDKMDYTYVEKDYNIKEKPKGNEIRLKLHGERNISEFTRFVIQVNFEALDIINTKIDNEVLQKGDLEIRIIAFMEFDYKKRWLGKIGVFLKHIYINYLLYNKIKDVYEGRLSREHVALRKELKQSLDFYN